MSIQAVAWVLGLDIPDPHEKLILISLANHANAEGFCWPTMRTIGKEASCDRRTVLRRLPKLIAAGLVRVIEATEGKQKLAHTYQLLLPGCDHQSQPPSRKKPAQASKALRPRVTRGCDSAVTTDNHHSTITSSKPPSKLSARGEAVARQGEELSSRQTELSHKSASLRTSRQQDEARHRLERSSQQQIQSQLVARLGDGDVGKGWLLFGELSPAKQDALTAQQRRGQLDEQSIARVLLEIKQHAQPP